MLWTKEATDTKKDIYAAEKQTNMSQRKREIQGIEDIKICLRERDKYKALRT